MQITENKMKHILTVARQCYEIAKNKYNLEESECQKAFMIGYLHDIGYEFSSLAINHPEIGFMLIKQTLGVELPEIYKHGKPDFEQDKFLAILNEADLTVNSEGKVVPVEDRLNDIKDRYSATSVQYIDALRLAKKLKLIL